jgi:MFS family permease
VGFLVPAGIGAAASLLSGHLLFRRDLEAKIPSGDRLKAAATSVPWRPILVVGVAMMCMYIADSTISSYGAKFLQNDLHATASVAPIGYVAYQIAMVISRTGGDRLVRRHGAVRVVAVGSVIGGLGLVAAAASVDPVLSISGFGVAGLGLSVVIPASFSAAGSVDPTGLGIAVSRVNVFNYLGYVFGAVIGGIFASDLWVAYAVAAVLTLVVLGLARGFRPHPVTEPVAAPA